MMKGRKKALPLGAAVVLLGGLVLGCGSDFLESPEVQKDPNRAVEVHPDQLFQSVQISQFFMQEGGLARTLTAWMQQMAGTDRQLLGYDRYEITEADHDVEMNNIYQGGGLIDIRNIIRETTERGWIEYRGIAKFYEAIVMGTGASIWGDLPYSEAVSDVEYPKLDEQADIYAALQNLLDEAIADLQSGAGGYLPPNDHVYGGDLTKWVEAAHSLKARFYMHWAEVDPTNYNLALQEAMQGISSIDGNFKSKHSLKETESNTWYQFYRERDSYIRAGKYLVDLLKRRNDPRLPIYFAPDANGEFTGSAPAEGNISASTLSDIFLAKDRSSDILTYEETQLIIAEAAYMTGDEETAREALNRTMAAIETKWNLDENSLPRYDASVTGEALFDAIMEEKYIALFLNIEVYNDWKRTGRPKIVAYGATDWRQSPKIIPHRLPYSDDERNANPNIPPPDQQPSRNDNDPFDPY
jgi:hypothetical protein